MAKYEEIPVNKDIIAWARNRAGLTQSEAAEIFAKIAAWEAGTSFPTYPQLEKLSEEFKLPIAAFFFPDLPKVPPIRESFRTLPDTEFDRIPRHVRTMLGKAKAYQLNLIELTQGRNPAPRLITRELRFRADASIPNLATQVRDYLGITLDDQFRWGGDKVALKAWRGALQSVGIFVFKDAFRGEGYSGFSLYDSEFPLIYVNNSHTKTRQIFTLFHELAHILFHTSGIDTDDERYIARLPQEQQRRIEVTCNKFAGEFLVPDDAFRRAMADRDRSKKTAEVIARQFSVSREVIYRKFLDRDWIDEGEYTRARRIWNQQKNGGDGGDWFRTQIAYLGRDYIELVFRQFYQNRIDDNQLADYLSTKLTKIGTLEEYFLKGGQ